MAASEIGWFARVVGAAIGGGGTYGVLSIVSWHPGLAIVLAASIAMAAFGAMFGPKIWEVVIHLF